MNDKLKDLIPIGKLYDDVAHPALEEVGSVLHNTVKTTRFLFAPIDYLAMQQDRFQNYLRRIGEKVEEQNLVESQPRIVGEVFESLKYTEQESLLTELFINLLANSIDKTKQNMCHPAFPNIIKQLSPDEAVILYFLKDNIYEIKNHSFFNQEKMLFTNNQIIYNKFPLEKLNVPTSFYVYMNHLNSLNLAGIWQKGNQVPTYENNKQNGVDIYNEIKLTEFGNMFVNSVIPKSLKNFSDINKIHN